MAKNNVHAALKRGLLPIWAWLVVGSLPVALCCAWVAGQAQAAGADDAWVPSMKAVHQKFKGERGTYAQFGDSITVSRAFWFGLKYARKNASPEMNNAFELVKDYMFEDCWDWRGPEYGNEGQMTIRWAHQNVDKWLKELDPEVALMMFGTNDLGSLELPEYQTKTREVVQKCLDNGTILILSTIPPKHGQAEKAAVFADAVRKIARDMKVPLTDYHAEILKRRPGDWDGAAEQFNRYQGYDAPTLISRDGVHPSNPQKYAGDYSAEGLCNNGFGLRSYLALMKYAEVIEKALPKKPAANHRVVEGLSDDKYYGRKIRVGIGKPPVAMAESTYLTFDYYVEGTDFLLVFLFDLDIKDNYRYQIDHPTIGKWATQTMKVTGVKPLKKGPKVDDIFFAGPPGSKTTRLMVDNVRLEGGGD